MARRFIKVGETYEKDGEQKIAFKTIGEVFDGKNGKTYAKLYTMPGVLLHVMEDKPKETAPVQDEAEF